MAKAAKKVPAKKAAAKKAPASQSIVGLAPYLTIDGAAKAIAFYGKAFGAEEVMRMPGQDGKKLMHAHIRINGGNVLMSDHFGDAKAPKPVGVTVHLQVDDADKWWNRAVKAGARVKMPIADQFWGDRYGQLTDPFGHSWSIGGPGKK
ncbi:MAG: glyoxalase/bleomycin resistance/extradiol dioxygenase family protein [Hyphomonadaceae bacterium]|nr:glyoxalase/bleomycin resistance/extradiol dioxygenase family protein [Hyphomonadaceae bacterium]